MGYKETTFNGKVYRKINDTELWVSKDGDILKISLLDTYLNTKNYPIVKYQRKVKLIHRLVAEAWIPNPHNYPVVMHLDNNRLNHSIDNLKWSTHKDNVIQASYQGRMNKKNRVWKYYEEAVTYFNQGKTRNWVRKKLHLGVITVRKFWDKYKNTKE